MRKRWTDEELVSLKEDYTNITHEEAEKKYNRTWLSIMSKALEIGLKRKNFKTYTTNIDLDEIKRLYLEGYSAPQLAKIAGCKSSKISLIIKNLGISRTGSECNRTYEVNETFFDEIDCEEKAYFLGFLYADGYNNGNGLVALDLQKSDIDILVTLNKLIHKNRPIKLVKNGKQASLLITNKRISDRLTELGCMKAKTFKLTFPDSTKVPEHLVHHFVRGYFDGDGCISICNYRKRNVDYITFKMLGTYEFMYSLREILMSNIELSKVKIAPKASIFALSYGGRINCVKIRNWLYKDATIYLQRKYDTFFRLNSSLKHCKTGAIQPQLNI